jgi:NAD(P)-dependent dehydrogenase (short-subunit alcohol dehydrogenase family)
MVAMWRCAAGRRVFLRLDYGSTGSGDMFNPECANPGEDAMDSMKIAFISGANKGIGLETARGLAKLGVRVLLGSRDAANGEAAVRQLQGAAPAGVEAIKFDATSAEDRQTLVAKLEREYGRLDILVNNAGIALDDADFGSPDGVNNTSSVTLDVLRATFETNFLAVVATTQALLPLLQQSESGRIVNLSSILGSLTLHSDPQSDIYAMKAFAYDASKTALNAFTVHLAHALRHSKIKVNSAHPGWVQTDMGGPAAPLPVSEGAKTSIHLATLPDDGPTGGYFYLDKPIPW